MILIIKQDAGPPDREQVDLAVRRFEWLVGFMICRFKFIHHMMGMMTKIPDNNIPTMGVCVLPNGKLQLRYNSVWTNALTDAELTYVFYHEVLHIALHHCTRRPLTSEPKEKDLANYAHDLAANELIPENDACQRPKNKDGSLCGVFVSELKKKKEYADIEERQTAEWYYDYLKDKWKNDKDKGGSGKYGKFDEHGDWAEHELADEKVSVKIQDIDQGNLWGDMSATQKELVMAAQVKRVNWRNLIRNWVGNIVWKDRIPTRKKPNRRTGMIHPGYKRSYTERGLATGDTSGSVGADLLAQYTGVLNQIVEMMPFDFAQCDAGITELPHPYDRRRDKIEFKGRGGTSFQPIIDLIDERGYKWAIILTDGEAPAPTRPKRARILWVVPPNHHPPVDWGEVVTIQRHV